MRRLFARRDAPEPAAAPPARTDVPLVVFAEDCRVSGLSPVVGPRLTDMLNNHDTVDLVTVTVQPLVGGSPHVFEQLRVPRDEILAAAGGGPRGDEMRRRNTSRYAVAIRAGPYAIRGDLHAARGVLDALAAFRRGALMAPLTDAVVEYTLGDREVQEEASVLVINRLLADAVSPL